MSEELSLVALSPADVPAAQQQLVAWCASKIHALEIERSDFIDSARVAEANNWQHEKLHAAAKRTERTIVYYQKIKQAAEAGYLVVPNFDVEIMAVRIKRKNPPTQEYQYASDIPDVKSDVLPAGEGRYVNPGQMYRTRRYTELNEKTGQRENKSMVRASSFIEDLEFPVLAVKPIVLDATARAMSLKLFDRIGVVTDRKEDPIVVGQVINPKDTGRWGGQPRVVSFFIAWWLDTRSL